MIRRLSTGDRGAASVPAVIAGFTAGALVMALALVEIVPSDRVQGLQAGGTTGSTVTGSGPQESLAPGETRGPNAPGASNAPGGGGGGTNNGGGAPGASGGPSGPVIPPSKFECRADKNGGATDRGVTANSISLATTIVASGIGSAFLGEMKHAMEAVTEQVNRAGGICGRKLVIETRDDGWDASTGAQYLRNYINDRSKFGIPVGASSEGLGVVIDSGDLDKAQFPVVGSDGLAINQYLNKQGQAQPWVWPIATATVSEARIMASEAYKRGARNFGVVFDRDYHFGKEAAAAYSAEVERLTGKPVLGYNTNNTCNQRFCGIAAGQNSYSGDAAKFKASNPDFVALFLEPETALTWMQDPNTPSATDKAIKYGYGGAQPLFTKQFESQCREKCDQMVVWSGFKPNVEKYRNDPAVAAYVRALKAKYRQADEFNQFTQSAYVGMQFLVEALKRVGPELTRQRLKAVLDHMTYDNGLTLQGRLTFTPQTRFANTTMQAFTMQYKGTPGGWRLGPIVKDPRPGVGVR
ncbi:MAG TPA: ABC transporter substrate-binding protein [Frankiaceae bacterium]|nr:ABC transporter substrate-binding protein [Frankiaceae bacterium]